MTMHYATDCATDCTIDCAFDYATDALEDCANGPFTSPLARLLALHNSARFITLICSVTRSLTRSRAHGEGPCYQRVDFI